MFLPGEGGEEGSPDDGDKLEGDDDNESVTPTSGNSPSHIDDDVVSPAPGDVPSPTSPRSVNDEPCNER